MAAINGSDNSETLEGTDSKDTLNGGAGDDTLYGEGGNDNLNGQAGDDTLYGGDGNDMLNGQQGDDSLYGDAGDDTLTGGAGADGFHYSFEVVEDEAVSERFTDWLIANGMGDYVGEDGQLLDGTGQGDFAKNYNQWLDYLVTKYDLAGGQDYIIELNQTTTGVPSVWVDGVDVLAGQLSEGEDFTFTTGRTLQTRYYSDLFSFGSGLTATSTDGHDTITDFVQGEDILDFSGLTAAQFDELFGIAQTDADDDGAIDDTVLTITGDDSWSLTLVGVTGFNPDSDIQFATPV